MSTRKTFGALAESRCGLLVPGALKARSARVVADLSYGIVLYANAALQGAVAGMQKALTVLRETKRIDEDLALVGPFAERQRLVKKSERDAMEQKYR